MSTASTSSRRPPLPVHPRAIGHGEGPRASVAARRLLRGPVARVLAVLLLLLQGATTAVLPLLDARADAAPRPAAHWEDASYNACPAPHDLAACRVCQLLGSGAETARGGAELAVLAWLGGGLEGCEDEILASARPRGPHGSRAPPVG